MINYLGKTIHDGVLSALKSRNQEDALRFSLQLSAVLLWPFPQRRRRNIRYFFPDLSEKERRDLVQRQKRYDALIRVHVAQGGQLTEGEIRDVGDFKGEDLIEEAQQEGKGLLVVGGHCGTWWLCPVAMAARGFKTNVVVNPDLFPPALEELKRLTNHFGIGMSYATRNAYAKIREALGRGEIVYLNVDVSMRPKRSVRLPFLGASLLMDPGPALLALRQAVPVLWASCYHHEDDRPAVRLRSEPSYGRDSELNTRDAILRHWIQRLEQDLTEHPEQWWPLTTKELQERRQA